MEHLHRTKIEWADRVWNPVTGCENNCPYCYARRFAKRFPKSFNKFRPTFHPERLAAPMTTKKGYRIFVCSMGELFGEAVPREWTEQVVNLMYLTPQHRYVVLSKAWPWPLGFEFPRNVAVGISVTGEEGEGFDPHFGLHEGTRLVCVEPLRADPSVKCLEVVAQAHWLIIGAQTGPGAIRPKWTWLAHVLGAVPDRCAVFFKDNLLRELPALTPRREIPDF